MVWAGFRVMKVNDAALGTEIEKTYPVKAVAAIQAKHYPGPLYNDFNWGGYLIWKLYPADRVFIDGRADLYGDEFMDQYSATYSLTGDWQRTLNRWQIATVMVPSQSALATTLPATGSWKPVFRDPHAVVLARVAPSIQQESTPNASVATTAPALLTGRVPEPSISPPARPRNSLPGSHSRGMIAASPLW